MTKICLLLITVLFMSPAHAIVDMKNANYSNTWVDFRLPAQQPAGELILERTYNSRTLFDGIFGFGWCTNYEGSLTVTAEGNLKRKSCGAGAEELFVAEPLTRQGVDTVIEAIIRKLKATAASYRSEQYYGQLRAELLEYDDKRTEMARELGLLGEPVQGRKYVLTHEQPWKVVENGTVREVAPKETAEIVFQDGVFRLKRSDGTQQYFDRDGRLLRLIDSQGRTLRLRYFDNGLLRSVSDAAGRSLRFEYYPVNRKVRRIFASNGSKAEYQYRNTNDLTFSIDSKRFATAYTYDDLHNVIKIVFTDGSRVRLTYDTNKDWVTGFIDRNNCQEDYKIECDAKDPKGHFRSTATKTCGFQITVRTRYEFWHTRTATGEYALTKVTEETLDIPDKRLAKTATKAVEKQQPLDCKNSGEADRTWSRCACDE